MADSPRLYVSPPTSAPVDAAGHIPIRFLRTPSFHPQAKHHESKPPLAAAVVSSSPDPSPVAPFPCLATFFLFWNNNGRPQRRQVRQEPMMPGFCKGSRWRNVGGSSAKSRGYSGCVYSRCMCEKDDGQALTSLGLQLFLYFEAG